MANLLDYVKGAIQGIRNVGERKQPTKEEVVEEVKKKTVTTGGAPSVDPMAQDTTSKIYQVLDGQIVIGPAFNLEAIPKIRGLVKINPDMSQAFSDTVALINTGIHEIKFDKSVTPEQAQEMRRYIYDQFRKFGSGMAGIHGHMNKMASQMLVGGAISNEWVPNRDYTEIVNLIYLNPENVAWVRKRNRYYPYQRVTHNIVTASGRFKPNTNTGINLKKLNPNTYKYYGILSDEDTPYGIPPYMGALSPIETQDDMIANIKFIMKCLGFLGYAEGLIEKPSQNDNESDAAYKARLDNLLKDFSEVLKDGMANGSMAGFKDDHEFNFNSTSQNTGNADSLWDINEQQVSSGLKFDGAFLGRSDASESSITILLTKMLAILNSFQAHMVENLEYGMTLMLRFKGYKFKEIKVELNKSTISDTLKSQQAQEIKIRNLRTLYMDGIINLDTYAATMGYPEADQDEPRTPIDANKVQDDKKDKEDRKDDKSKSQRGTRDKKNPQGTVKRQS